MTDITNTEYHTEGVIAFVPTNLDAPDQGTLGVYVKDGKDRLFFYPWLPALRSKSDHVLNTPVARMDAITWRLQPTKENSTDWFDPFVPTNESPVRLKRVAKTKARALSLALNDNADSDSLEWLEYMDKTDNNGDNTDPHAPTIPSIYPQPHNPNQPDVTTKTATPLSQAETAAKAGLVALPKSETVPSTAGATNPPSSTTTLDLEAANALLDSSPSSPHA